MATLIDTSIYHDDLLTVDAEEKPEPLTEAQRASVWDDDAWNQRDDATADELDRARWAYARPVGHIDLWDEPRWAA